MAGWPPDPVRRYDRVTAAEHLRSRRALDTMPAVFDGGMDRLSAALARALGARIQHSAPVVRIEPGEDRVGVVAQRDGIPRVCPADRVLLTVPFSMLREIEVSPAFFATKRPAGMAVGRPRGGAVAGTVIDRPYACSVEPGWPDFCRAA